jgi:predicted nucleotidyltransferase
MNCPLPQLGDKNGTLFRHQQVITTMDNLIQQQLEDIERSSGVSILYACESGSRAWGFASRDSDWDVRFIYLYPPEWYLAVDLEHKKDVIEQTVGDLDISGWDLRKALWLFRKSNPPLLEWLHSPIVYHDRFGLAGRLRDLLPTYYSQLSCAHHYLHMAEGNFREYLRGDTVRTKKYLYVLRPLLALHWIETHSGSPPVLFDTLVEVILPSGQLKNAVHELLARKKAGGELEEGPRIPAISDYLEKELARLADRMPGLKKINQPETEPLNRLFREMLEEVWGNSNPA